MINYVDEHFEREEQLMHEYGYPGIVEHKVKHREMARQVYAVGTLYSASPEAVDVAKLVEFLRKWLIVHIIGDDRDYVPYLQDSTLATETSTAHIIMTSKPSELISTELNVPKDKAHILKRCAEILSEGGEAALELEDQACPMSEMTLQQAKIIASFLLIKP